jgi:glutaminase
MQSTCSPYPTVHQASQGSSEFIRRTGPALSPLGATKFAVAVCTVDGQQFSYGDVSHRFPIMETVAPLLHALVLRDCGVEETHKVGEVEDTSCGLSRGYGERAAL